MWTKVDEGCRPLVIINETSLESMLKYRFNKPLWDMKEFNTRKNNALLHCKRKNLFIIHFKVQYGKQISEGQGELLFYKDDFNHT